MTVKLKHLDAHVRQWLEAIRKDNQTYRTHITRKGSTVVMPYTMTVSFSIQGTR